jgi:hypothetical protein
LNFKAKNIFDIFDEMTIAEWISNAHIVNNGKTDLELIIEKILEE